MKNKIEVLKYIATELNAHNFSWALGGSAMLYLRRITSQFNDLDFLIDENVSLRVDHLIKALGREIETIPNPSFQSRFFKRYEIFGVRVDLIAGFQVNHQGVTHHFPLDAKRSDEIKIDGVSIYLSPLKMWWNYYHILSNHQRLREIENYVNNQTKKA